MSVTWLHELGRNDGSLDDKGTVQYVRTFQVLTSDLLNDGPYTVRTANGIPRVFDPYVYGVENDNTLCADVTARRDEDNPYLWIVTAHYSSDAQTLSWGAQDPTQRPPRSFWSFERRRIVLEQDVVGNPIVNSAGDPFDPPIEIDETVMVLRIEKNLSAYDPTAMLPYMDALNSDNFKGFVPGYVKVEDISGDEDYENGVHFYRCRFIFHIRDGGWTISILDAGYQQLNASNQPTVIRDPSSGQPYSSPQLLDANGHALAHGATPHYVQYVIYDSLPFAPLQLEG